MNKKVVINICSEQSHDTEGKIEIVTLGSLIKKNDEYHIVYEESEISGMEGTTTTVKSTKDSVIISREGTTTTIMEFKKNNNSMTIYNTPYGAMDIKIFTKNLEIEIDDMGGNIFIEYSMVIGGQSPLNTKLNMSIRTK